MSEMGVSCAKNEGSVCQKWGFCVPKTGVLCVENRGSVCRKQGFCVSKIEFRVSEIPLILRLTQELIQHNCDRVRQIMTPHAFHHRNTNRMSLLAFHKRSGQSLGFTAKNQ